MRKFVLIGLVAGAIVSHSLADGAALYKKCIVCHGPDAGKTPPGHNKTIDGLTKDEIVSSLKGYKDGSYGGKLKALMLGQVRGLSDEDMNALADHIVDISK